MRQLFTDAASVPRARRLTGRERPVVGGVSAAAPPWSPTPFLSASPALAGPLPRWSWEWTRALPGPPRASGGRDAEGQVPEPAGQWRPSPGRAWEAVAGACPLPASPLQGKPGPPAAARGCTVQGPLGGQAVGEGCPWLLTWAGVDLASLGHSVWSPAPGLRAAAQSSRGGGSPGRGRRRLLPAWTAAVPVGHRAWRPLCP